MLGRGRGKVPMKITRKLTGQWKQWPSFYLNCDLDPSITAILLLTVSAIVLSYFPMMGTKLLWEKIVIWVSYCQQSLLHVPNNAVIWGCFSFNFLLTLCQFCARRLLRCMLLPLHCVGAQASLMLHQTNTQCYIRSRNAACSLDTSG